MKKAQVREVSETWCEKSTRFAEGELSERGGENPGQRDGQHGV